MINFFRKNYLSQRFAHTQRAKRLTVIKKKSQYSHGILNETDKIMGNLDAAGKTAMWLNS